MKRFLTAAAVLTLLLAAIPAFAVDPKAEPEGEKQTYDRTSVIDDIIRMSKAGVDDDVIIKFVQEKRDLYVVDADVIIALTDAKVSKNVLQVVMDEAYDGGSRRADRRYRHGTRTVYLGSYPPYGYYDPWFYPYSYSPYWYGWGPRFSVGFRFGGHRHFGGGHRGHRGRR